MLKNLLRAIKLTGIRCKLRISKRFTRIILDLSSYRVADNVAPFSSTGMEHTGPFVVKLFRKTKNVDNLVHLLKCSSSASRFCSMIGHRVLSRCHSLIHCTSRKTTIDYFRQLDNYNWSSY